MKIEIFERGEGKGRGIYITGDLNSPLPAFYTLRKINGKTYRINLGLNQQKLQDALWGVRSALPAGFQIMPDGVTLFNDATQEHVKPQ